MKKFLLIIILYLLVISSNAKALDIPLTIIEPVSVSRTNSPVTSGVPIPPGTQSDSWSLWDGNSEIPVQVTNLGGRTPWILLDFQVSVPAGETKVFTLKDIGPSTSPPQPITISEDTSLLTVITGPLKLTINKTEFNLFDSVWLDRDSNGTFSGTEQIISLQANNLQLMDSTTGKAFYGKGTPNRIEWEYRGPIRSTLRVDGDYVGFANGLSYTTRITFYAGRADVKIEHVIRNSYQPNERHVKIKSAIIKIGNGVNSIRANRPGSISWGNINSNGLSFEIIPINVNGININTNNGLLIPDWSYHGASLVVDYSEGLSEVEQSKRESSVKSTLFALANASWYSKYGEMSTTKFSTLEDEKNTYSEWGWTWNPNKEPTDAHKPDYFISWKDVDVHGETESDDLWQHNLMFIRTGERGYFDRAKAWARYMKWEYPFRTDSFDFAWDGGWEDGNNLVSRPKITIPLTSEDNNYLSRVDSGKVDSHGWGADHIWGWGLIDYYYLTGDKDALHAAEELAEVSQRLLGYKIPGTYTIATYGVRQESRHLALMTRVYEATQKIRWKNHMDHVANLFLQSPDWDTRGSYLWYAKGYPKTTASVHFGFNSYAFDRYYEITGNSQIKSWIIDMANFAYNYGLSKDSNEHPNYTHRLVFDSPNPGDWFHLSGSDPTYTVGMIDALIRGYRLTNDTKFLERAKFHWHRGSKAAYGTMNRIASDNEVGRFMNNKFFYDPHYDYNKGDFTYAHLLFYEYAHLNTDTDTVAPSSPTRLRRK